MIDALQRPTVRLGLVLAGVAAVAGLCTFVVMGFLRSNLATVSFAHEPGTVNLTVQTVPSIGFGTHPTWVAYLVRSPSGQWVHSTLWTLPADRLIHMTVDEYDSGGALRNAVWGGVTGTAGGTATLNGKTGSVFSPAVGNGIAHTFNVPDLGINVPLYGISANAKNPCSVAPCSTSFDHNTVSFSFRTPPGAGDYRWQCFVPCGLSYLYGNGGPMSQVGFMSGFLKVVPA